MSIFSQHCYSILFFFKIQKENTLKFKEAVENKLLSHFTLKRNAQSQPAGEFNIIPGQIRYMLGEHMYIDLDIEKSTIDRFKAMFKENCLNDNYDIMFHSNRTTFLYQHNALEWMKRHHLFSCLIDDKLYRNFRESSLNVAIKNTRTLR